jgi:hypothetical protein
MPFWDSYHMVMKQLGDEWSGRIVKIPYVLGLVMAWVAGLWGALTRQRAHLTAYVVRIASLTQTYSMGKVG